jgi:hypothetical protein
MFGALARKENGQQPGARRPRDGELGLLALESTAIAWHPDRVKWRAT